MTVTRTHQSPSVRLVVQKGHEQVLVSLLHPPVGCRRTSSFSTTAMRRIRRWGCRWRRADERNRYSIQLYHRTATQADLSGKQVLEVSCGHGGGASYRCAHVAPGRPTPGWTYNADAIAFCPKRHNLPGLDFVHGDAESLPFPDESFDAVINVEASHAYPHFPPFPRRSGARAAPGRAFPVRRFPQLPRTSPEWEAATGRRRRCGCSRSGSSMRRFCAGWTTTRAAVPGPSRSAICPRSYAPSAAYSSVRQAR